MTPPPLPGDRHLLVTGAGLGTCLRTACAPHFATITEVVRPVSPAAILEAGHHATDYILGGPEYLGRTMLESLPRLRRVILLGTGVPSFVDRDAVRERGIDLRNTPHMNADSVAEFAVAALVMTAARSAASGAGVRTGTHWRQTPWRTLSDSRIGLVGLGHIGEALARRLRAMGARDLRYCSRTRKPRLEADLGIRWQPLAGLIGACHAVCFHVPYSAATHGLIDDGLLRGGSADLTLLCFSNPRIVDPAAIRRALADGRLGHLYLDGYFREWTENRGAAEDPEGLLGLPPEQVTVTSHIAAQTTVAIAQQLARAVEVLIEA